MRLDLAGHDLHVHSVYSDGLDTPAELLSMAALRLARMSICDHDTIEAYAHLPTDSRTEVLPGVELSTRLPDGDGLHLLAYFPGGFTDEFRTLVERCAQQRKDRVIAGVQALRERGVPLRWRVLEECVGVGVPCRSHVARALVRVGLARSPQVVFGRYLTSDLFPPPELGVRDAIQQVLGCGGVPVWAHPSPEDVDRVGPSLVAAGLAGVECHLPRRSAATTRALLAFAERHQLQVTGGSDHHGTSRRWPLGRFSVPAERITLRVLQRGVAAACP